MPRQRISADDKIQKLPELTIFVISKIFAFDSTLSSSEKSQDKRDVNKHLRSVDEVTSLLGHTIAEVEDHS